MPTTGHHEKAAWVSVLLAGGFVFWPVEFAGDGFQSCKHGNKCNLDAERGGVPRANGRLPGGGGEGRAEQGTDEVPGAEPGLSGRQQGIGVPSGPLDAA